MLVKQKLSIVAGCIMVFSVMMGVLYGSCAVSEVPFVGALLVLAVALLGCACLVAGIWFIIRAFL